MVNNISMDDLFSKCEKVTANGVDFIIFDPEFKTSSHEVYNPNVGTMYKELYTVSILRLSDFYLIKDKMVVNGQATIKTNYKQSKTLNLGLWDTLNHG